MSHTPTPYMVKKIPHTAPEILAVRFVPTPTSKALIRRVAIVLLEGGSEGMEEALENAAFIVEACNAYDAPNKDNATLQSAVASQASTITRLHKEKNALLKAAKDAKRLNTKDHRLDARRVLDKAIALCEGGAE